MWNPMQLDNGKWACNHKCKDKTAYARSRSKLSLADDPRCKHLCCREGVEKPPKPPKTATPSIGPSNEGLKGGKQEKSKGDLRSQPAVANTKTARKRSSDNQPQDIHVVDMTKFREDNEYAKVGPRDYKNLHRLHHKVNKPAPSRILPLTKPKFSYASGDEPSVSFLSHTSNLPHSVDLISSDYGDDWMEDLPSTSLLLGQSTGVETPNTTAAPPTVSSSPREVLDSKSGTGERADAQSEEDLSDLEAAMVGMDDSRAMTSQSPIGHAMTPEGVPRKSSWAFDQINKDNGRRSQRPSSSVMPGKDGSSKAQCREARLFLSTDSTDKPSSVLKRRHSIGDQDVPISDPTETPMAKRKKVFSTRGNEQESTVTAKNRSETANSGQALETPAFEVKQITMKERFSNAGRPLPAWVEELDPNFFEDFLKDYGHLVELV